MRIPCDDNCICVPICRNKTWSRMINECKLMMKLLLQMENELPRNQGNQVHIFSMGRTYTISKDENGVVTWTGRETRLTGMITSGMDPRLILFDKDTLDSLIWSTEEAAKK